MKIVRAIVVIIFALELSIASVFAQESPNSSAHGTPAKTRDVLDKNPPPKFNDQSHTRQSHVQKTTSQNNEGWFMEDSGGNTLENVILLKQGDESTVIRQYLSPRDNPYRLWVDDNAGTFPVPLHSREAFDNFLTHIGNREAEGKHWCEIVEDPWGPWSAVGGVPTGCGVHNYTERRQCIAASKADKPCPDSCGGATHQDRAASVNNGTCNHPLRIRPGNVTAFCNAGIWTAPNGQAPSTFAASCNVPSTFISTNQCGGTRTDSCIGVCDTTFFAPGGVAPATFAASCNIPNTFVTSDQCGSSRTENCTNAPCDPNSWTAPNGQPPATFAASCNIPGTFTSTNACGDPRPDNCTGTPPPPPPPPPVNGTWSNSQWVGATGCLANPTGSLAIFPAVGSCSPLGTQRFWQLVQPNWGGGPTCADAGHTYRQTCQ